MGKQSRRAGGRALSGLIAAILLSLSATADAQGGGNPQSFSRWSAHVREASARFGIPEDWIWRVMRAESGGRTMLDGRPITSRAGAMGLMQLMPGTWAEMRRKHGLGANAHDPRDNILAGTAYLRAMHDRFGYPGLFAAYNAGPARYAEHLVTGRRLPLETAAYVATVGGTARGPVTLSSWKVRNGGLFVARSDLRSPAIEAVPLYARSTSLFVRLSTASAPSQ